MSTLKHIALFITLALGCDPSTAPDPVEFRNGDPEVLYLSQNDAKISLQDFAKMVLACDGIQSVQLAVTETAYPEVFGAKKERVLGLGFSTLAETKLIDCYHDLMIDLGAHP